MKIVQNLVFMPLTLLMMTLPKVVYTSAKINEIKFADPNLEAFVRDIIRKPSETIYKNDVKGLVSLTIDYRAYTHIDRDSIRSMINLSGLEHFSRLNYLEIKNTSISILSPLSNLTNLIERNLCQNRISNINPLTRLSGLDELYLEYNMVRDLAFLLDNKFRLSSRWKHDSITYYASGIKIYINGNPLSDTSINEYIPQLIDMGIVVNC